MNADAGSDRFPSQALQLIGTRVDWVPAQPQPRAARLQAELEIEGDHREEDSPDFQVFRACQDCRAFQGCLVFLDCPDSRDFRGYPEYQGFRDYPEYGVFRDCEACLDFPDSRDCGASLGCRDSEVSLGFLVRLVYLVCRGRQDSPR